MCAAALVVAGCGGSESVREYVTKKTPRERMLAVIVKGDKQAWFFKLSGPEDDIAAVDSQFVKFAESVQFDEKANPTWTLPEGWQRLPDNAPQNRGTIPRYATLTVPVGGEPTGLEVSVSSLALGPFISDGEGWDFYRLKNVNRWRGQLQLLPMRSAKELNENSKQVELADRKAILVDITGKPQPKAEDKPTQLAGAGGLPPGHPPTLPKTDTPVVRRDSGLKFDKPTGWTAAALKPFSVETFEVKDGDNQVVITVTPVGGGVLFNVNRWRGQPGVELEPFKSEQDLKSVLQDVTIDGVKGVSIELVGKSQTIIGVIVTKDRQQWVIKLMGDNELAQREKENFNAFVSSLKF